MSKIVRYIITACLMVFNINSFSQFAPDPTYGTAGVHIINVDTSTSLFLPDNKVMIAYPIAMSYPYSSPAFGVRKFNSDGTLDTSFATNGIATYTAASYKDRFDVYTVTMQSDGKIVIAGQTYQVGGFAYYYNFFVFRFNADGTKDTNFGTDGLVKYSLNSTSQFRERFIDLAVDASNRIVAVGYTTADVDQKNDAVAFRFLENGNLDPSFAINGILKLTIADSDYFNHIYMLSDGAMLLTGTTVSGTSQNVTLSKINGNGTFDTSFGVGGMSTVNFASGSFAASKLFFNTGNKIMMVGSNLSDTGSSAAFAQFNSDGSLDTTFSTDGKNITYIPVFEHYSIGAPFIVQLPDNKYFIASTTKRNSDSTNNYDFAFARIKEDTTLDTSFSSNGVYLNVVTGTNEFARGLYLQDDGKPLLLENSRLRRYVWDLSTLSTQNISSNPDVVSVTPNPFSNKIEITSNSLINKVEVYNIEGRKIKTVNNSYNEIDLSSAEKGIYFVKVFGENKTNTQKLIKN